MFALTGKNGTYGNALDTCVLNSLCHILGNKLVTFYHYDACSRINYVWSGISAVETIGKRLYNLISFHDCCSVYALGSKSFATIVFSYYNVLRYVYQSTSKVSRVRSLKCGIRKTFSSAVRRNEIFQNRKTFSERRTNGNFQSFTLRVSHKTTHTGKLSNLFHATTCTGYCHHVDRVKLVERLFERFRYFVVCYRPLVDNELVLFVFGHKTSIVKFFDVYNSLFRLVQNTLLFFGYVHIEYGRGYCADGRIFITERFYAVQNFNGFGCALKLKGSIYYLLQFRLIHAYVDFQSKGIGCVAMLYRAVFGFVQFKTEILRNNFVKYNSADGGLNTFRNGLTVNFSGYSNPDFTLKLDFFVSVCHLGFVFVTEDFAFALSSLLGNGKIETSEYHILRGRTYRSAVTEL